MPAHRRRNGRTARPTPARLLSAQPAVHSRHTWHVTGATATQHPDRLRTLAARLRRIADAVQGAHATTVILALAIELRIKADVLDELTNVLLSPPI